MPTVVPKDLIFTIFNIYIYFHATYKKIKIKFLSARVLSIHPDSFGVICRGWEVSAVEISANNPNTM